MTSSDTLTKGSISFIVPGVPPSVNHYARHTRKGIHYVIKEARDFKMMVLCAAQRRSIRAQAYEVWTTVYLGKRCRGDLDNFCKLIGDALVTASVIDSDSKITKWTMRKDRDHANPRTEIKVFAI